MLLTNHVLVGALIGAGIARPTGAFLAGVLSHAVLDALPHWGHPASRQEFLTVAVADGLCGLAMLVAATAAAPRERRAAVLAGALGAALPDVDKPWKEVFGASPFPAAVNRFHSRIQDEAHDRMAVDVCTAVGLAVVGSTLARRRPAAAARA